MGVCVCVCVCVRICVCVCEWECVCEIVCVGVGGGGLCVVVRYNRCMKEECIMLNIVKFCLIVCVVFCFVLNSYYTIVIPLQMHIVCQSWFFGILPNKLL